jgi:hypothetical protein
VLRGAESSVGREVLRGAEKKNTKTFSVMGPIRKGFIELCPGIPPSTRCGVPPMSRDFAGHKNTVFLTKRKEV